MAAMSSIARSSIPSSWRRVNDATSFVASTCLVVSFCFFGDVWMTKAQYTYIEDYMLECMRDSAHDKAHVYRVLYMALAIAREQRDVDLDILTAACLLHDIGRPEQFSDPHVCHALAGGEKAYRFLLGLEWTENRAGRVRACVQSHRYRGDNPPSTLEAKILFDADKLDVAGAIGIARTFLYIGQVSGSLYSLNDDGRVLDGTTDTEPSFFHEYKFKLEKLYDGFYTPVARQMAERRRHAATEFYAAMLDEVVSCHELGKSCLDDMLAVPGL